MRKFYLTIVLLLSVGFALNTMAQRSIYGEQGRSHDHNLNLRFGEVIYDQSADEEYGGYIVSQFFTDTASADYTSECADDFVVPEGETWVVGSFGVWGTWWPGSAGNPEKINVAVYENDNGKPGALIDGYSDQSNFYSEEWTNPDGELQSYYNFTFPTPISFSEGHYWISFQVNDSYDKVGQWGWEDKTNEYWETWHWKNPGGGFPGGGTNEWKSSTLIHMFGYALDNRFALYAEAYDNDVATIAITNPVTGVLTDAEAVTITIKNQGKNTQTGFDVAYSVNGGAWITENVGSLSIDSEEFADYTFTTTADLSETGFYTIVAKTILAGDEYTDNDETSADVVNYGEIYPMVNNDTVDVTTCSGTFTDMGGPEGVIYGGNNGVITFYPGETGKKMKLDFFGTWDISHTTNGEKPFQIYDGPDMNSPLIGEWTQNDYRDYGLKPETIKALGETGALTIRYLCPTWDEVEGWTALVSCYEQPEDDFEVSGFIVDPTLIFTDRDITLSTTVRNIGSTAQSKNVTFYVNDVAVGNVNTGVVQPTEFATVEYVHQFTESGDVVIKTAVPEDSGDTPENNFMVLENFVYQNGWFVEMFDDGYFPPEDWTANLWLGSSNGYDGSAGAAECNIPTFTEDTLVTPKLVIHDGDILTFYAATSLWWPGNLKVAWMDSETGEWELLEYIDLGGSPQYKEYQVDVSAAAGENYIGFIDVADISYSWSGNVLVDHVIGIGVEFFYFDNDMKMMEFNPNPTPSKNEPTDYEVIVKNNGHNAMAAGDYDVKIMMVNEEGDDIEMASVPGIACEHLQEKTHTLTVTFPEIGPAQIYAVVDLIGDEKPNNNGSIVRPVYIQVDGTNTVQVGDGDTESWQIPSPLGQPWSVSQVIYPADLVNPNRVTGYITGISYQFNNTNTGATLDVPVHIYIGETDENNIADGFINGTSLSKVAETTVDLQRGLNQQLYIPFTAPYDYQGENLCVMFFKPNDGTWYQGVNWLVTEMEDDSISGYASSYNPPIDPTDLKEWEPFWQNYMPNTAFYIADVGTVSLDGVVTDTIGTPMEDVMVEVVGFDNSTMTLNDGSYELTELLAWETVIKATKFQYFDNAQEIILREGFVNTLDFEMIPLPVVTVNALVVGNDDTMNYLEGAEVTFEGYENYATTVGADGTFEIPGVYGDKTYNLTITYPGFEDYTADVDVENTDLDLGTIALNESMLIPFYTQAVQTNPGTVQVTWNAPLDGVTDVLTWEYYINNGYAAEIGEEVWLGNIYEMDPGTITKVSLYWAKYGETSGTVRLDLVDLDGNVFYSSESFETVHNGWTHVDVPNITFEGGQFLAMAYWDGTNPEQTDYLAVDQYESGTGINYGYIMYPNAPAYPLSDVFPDYDFTFQIDVTIVTANEEPGRYNEGYNIFVGPYADINNWESWEPINSEPVTGIEYFDGDWPQPEEGYTYGVQTVYTTGVSEVSFSMPIVHDPDLPCENPWSFVQTGSVHAISIPYTADVNIFGEPLENGDWIGVFYLNDDGEEVCGGAGKWGPFGNGGAVISAYGDDITTPEKDGFAEGEMLRWRMHTCDTWTEYPAGATYNESKPNQGYYADFGLSALTSLQVMFCQQNTFSQGWNSISSYIVPFDPAVETMFEPIMNELTILRNLSLYYWPEENFNSIGNWDNNSGYVVKVTEDADFEICGNTFASNEITLEEAGWYYLPVLSQCDVNLTDLLADVMDDIVIVQDIIGDQVYWPAQQIYTLETLIPGNAYKMKIANPITLIFPDCDGENVSPAVAQVNTIETPWGQINMSPESQVISFPAKTLAEMSKGDAIGAFDQNNNICGYIEIDDSSQDKGMIVFGDDITTHEKDGFTDGANITFRAFKNQSQEEVTLNVEWDFSLDNASGNFYAESLSAVKSLSLAITGVGAGSIGTVSIYPNPASDVVAININTDSFNTAQVTIIDTKGNVVMENRMEDAQATLNISSLESGIYFVKVDSDQFNKVSKLIVK